MLRRLARRVGTLGALWTLAVLGAPSLLPACGMHGTHAGGHAAPAVLVDGGAHDAHAMHMSQASHAATPTGSQAGTRPDAPADDCQCLDCCCAAGPVAFGIRATMRFREIITPSHAGWWATSEPAPPRALALRLPFANGPPTQHG